MFIRVLGNLFLFSFALDAGLSVIDDLAKWMGAAGIGSLRSAVALFVVLQLLPLFACSSLTRGLPARVFLPLVGVAVWGNLGAAPMGMFFEDPHAFSLAVSSFQAAAAAAAFLTLRYGTESASWTLPRSEGRFEPLRFAAFGIGSLVLGPVLLAGYLVVAIATFAHQATAGFLAFDTTGIHMVERHYEKAGREIWLVGMIHIGSGDTYAQIFDSFGGEDTLVLEEGVTDDQDLLGKRLPYDALIEPLGVERQTKVSSHFAERRASGDEWPHVQRADLDTSNFTPATIAYMQGMGEAVEAFEAEDYAKVQQVVMRPAMQAPNVRGVMQDILERRDEHVLEALETALPSYRRVIVPWGAAHQRRISQVVTGWGFEQTSSRRHLALEWSGLLRALGRLGTESRDEPASSPAP